MIKVDPFESALFNCPNNVNCIILCVCQIASIWFGAQDQAGAVRITVWEFIYRNIQTQMKCFFFVKFLLTFFETCRDHIKVERFLAAL